MNQTTIFDMMYPKYKITKPIRLIELFGGYIWKSEKEVMEGGVKI